MEILSLHGATVAFGNKSAMLLQSIAPNTWGFSGQSASRIAATGHDNATKLGIALDTLIGDLIARGILTS